MPRPWPHRAVEFDLRPAGATLSFEARVTQYGEGEFLLILRDISERKADEAELIVTSEPPGRTGAGTHR